MLVTSSRDLREEEGKKEWIWKGGYRAIMTGAEGLEDLAAFAALILEANSSLLTTALPNK